MKDPAGALNHHQAWDKLLICDLLPPLLVLEGVGQGGSKVRRKGGKGGRKGAQWRREVAAGSLQDTVVFGGDKWEDEPLRRERESER